MEKVYENYLLKKELGAGAFGTVYLAEHKLLRHPCAIKILNPMGLARLDAASRAAAVAKFHDEARILAKLKHPHIVSVFDGGTAQDGSQYFVMECVPGEVLRDYLGARGKRLEIEVATQIVVQIASALGAAHQAGVIHRDIKPENVMVESKAGRPFVKLLDFGIARLTGEAVRLRDSGGHQPTQAPSGTPFYMPPEQWSQPHDFHGFFVGPHSDVYALGCLLYELVAGRLPFRGDTIMELCHLHTQVDVKPTPPRAHNPAIPVALEVLIMRTLEKLPGKRVKTMEEIIDALGGDPSAGPAKPTLEQQLELLRGAADSPEKGKALNDLKEAHPKRPEVYVALVSYHNRLQRSDKAIEVWRAATVAMPESGPMFGGLGKALAQSARQEEAIAALSTALRLGLPEREQAIVENALDDVKRNVKR